METELIETGRIVNTHGIRGELRMQPWADSPERLCAVSHLYIDGKPVKVCSAKIHKSNIILHLDGVDDVDSAIKYKNKVVSISRCDIAPAEGTHFIADIIGINAIDAQTGALLGRVTDVLTLPAQNVYVIKTPAGTDKKTKREMLVPAVPEFIVETNPKEGYVKIQVMEGL